MPMPGQQGDDREITVVELRDALNELILESDFVDQPVVLEDIYGAEAKITNAEAVNGVMFLWPSVNFEENEI